MKQQPVYFTPEDHYSHTDLTKTVTQGKNVPSVKLKSNDIYFIEKLSTVLRLSPQKSKLNGPESYLWLSSSQKKTKKKAPRTNFIYSM